jgi:hypothetical protein
MRMRGEPTDDYEPSPIEVVQSPCEHSQPIVVFPTIHEPSSRQSQKN